MMVIAKHRFHMNVRMGYLITQDAKILSRYADKLDALMANNFISDAQFRLRLSIVTSAEMYKQCDDKELHCTTLALESNKNSSASGPAGINYRLIKMIEKYRLGKVLLNDIFLYMPSTTSVSISEVPYMCRDMKVVMIHKRN